MLKSQAVSSVVLILSGHFYVIDKYWRWKCFWGDDYECLNNNIILMSNMEIFLLKHDC